MKENSRINIYISLVILFFVFALTVILLMDRKNSNTISIVGTWEANEEKTDYSTLNDKFIFNSDNTCVNIYRIDDQEYSDTCKYKITKEKLTITYTNDAYWDENESGKIKTKTFSYVLNENLLSFDDETYYKK